MSRRRLALALLIYVACDFGNPLMPGAVQFDGGSVDVVQADRTRPEAAGMTVAPSPTPEPVVDLIQIQAAGRRSAQSSGRRHQIATRVWRAPFRPSSGVIPPSSEDH